jgi:hypothetical protein
MIRSVTYGKKYSLNGEIVVVVNYKYETFGRPDMVVIQDRSGERRHVIASHFRRDAEVTP